MQKKIVDNLTLGNPEQRETRLISPNELHMAAIATMLDGRQPADMLDWQKIVNFWAYNVAPASAVPSVMIMALIYRCPLPEDVIQGITEFQLARRRQAMVDPRVIEGTAVRVSKVAEGRTLPATVLYEPKQLQS
jgi:hypothetical protein